MSLVVLKIGGAALKDYSCIKQIVNAVIYLKELNHQIVLVHGGGPLINTKLMEKGISWSFHEGQRITTSEMMSCIESAFLEINEQICFELNKAQINTATLIGYQDSLIECEQSSFELGLVGKIRKINSHSLFQLLDQGLIPVIAPIGVNVEGAKFNINADWAAAHIANSLHAKSLVYCTDQIGVLDSNGLPYDNLTTDQIDILIDKQGVHGGMLVKAETIQFSIKNNVKNVFVLHGRDVVDLFQNGNVGTNCSAKSFLEYQSSMQVG